MFNLYADKNKLILQQKGPVTSGSVNVYTARFGFSREWAGLERIAVFRCGDKAVSVLLDESGECLVPWEVLTTGGQRLEAGVYGTRGGETVLPTAWADLGMVLTGVSVPEGGAPPRPEIWEEVLAKKGDRLGYTESGGLGLYAGGELLSSVPGAGAETAGDEDVEQMLDEVFGASRDDI